MRKKGTPTTGQKGRLTRQMILWEAILLASEKGLDGLTFGPLAEASGMSKAGLFAHFGSRQALQLATLRSAREIFEQDVFLPAFKLPRGATRLTAVLDSWLRFVESGTVRGGSLFVAAGTEFDGRPGPVRDLVAETLDDLRQSLARMIGEAQASGELNGNENPVHLAFELFALVAAANNDSQLYGRSEPIRIARAIINERLRAWGGPDLSIGS